MKMGCVHAGIDSVLRLVVAVIEVRGPQTGLGPCA